MAIPAVKERRVNFILLNIFDTPAILVFPVVEIIDKFCCRIFSGRFARVFGISTGFVLADLQHFGAIDEGHRIEFRIDHFSIDFPLCGIVCDIDRISTDIGNGREPAIKDIYHIAVRGTRRSSRNSNPIRFRPIRILAFAQDTAIVINELDGIDIGGRIKDRTVFGILRDRRQCREIFRSAFVLFFSVAIGFIVAIIFAVLLIHVTARIFAPALERVGVPDRRQLRGLETGIARDGSIYHP